VDAVLIALPPKGQPTRVTVLVVASKINDMADIVKVLVAAP